MSTREERPAAMTCEEIQDLARLLRRLAHTLESGAMLPAAIGPSRKGGSARCVLAEAKTFPQWCKERPRSWLRVHPLTEVKGVGKRRHGKPQLRPEEGLKGREVALQLAAEEDGACAALLLLDTGARPGEVVSRQVRDLIDDARWVLVDGVEGEDGQGWSPKTERSKRPLGPVPADLRRLLLAQAKGKLPQSYLFPGKDAAPHDVGWVDNWVKRICRRAGVPERCAHSLRGLRTTLDLLAGRQLREVANDRGMRTSRPRRPAMRPPGRSRRPSRGATCAWSGRRKRPGILSRTFPETTRAACAARKSLISVELIGIEPTAF
jgi:integrase